MVTLDPDQFVDDWDQRPFGVALVRVRRGIESRTSWAGELVTEPSEVVMTTS